VVTSTRQHRVSLSGHVAWKAPATCEQVQPGKTDPNRRAMGCILTDKGALP